MCAVVVNLYGKADLKQIERAQKQLQGMKSEISSQGSAWSTAGTKIAATGDKMAGAGRSMTMGLTLPVVAATGASVMMAAKFEGAMELIQTQAGGSAADVKSLSDAVLKLGASSQHGPEELANALYHLKSVGMDNKAAMDALTQSEKLASVGGANLEATTNAVAGAYKSGIKGAQTFGDTVGTLNGIIGAGNMRMEDLNSAMGTGVLVTAKTYGVSLASIGSAMAMMTSRGIPAVKASAALKMAMSSMGSPTDKAASAMALIGLRWDELAKANRKGGLVESIGLLKQHLSGLSAVQKADVLTKMFGAKSSQAVLTLLGNVEDFRRTQDLVISGSTKFGEAVKVQAEGADAKWARFTASMKTLGITFGNVLLPMATRVGDVLAKVGTWVAGLDSGWRKLIITAGLVVAAVGPMLLVFGKLFTGIGQGMNAVKSVGGWLSGLKNRAAGAGGGPASTVAAGAPTNANTAAEQRNTIATNANTAAQQRGTAATNRETLADSRQVAATNLETAADRKSAVASSLAGTRIGGLGTASRNAKGSILGMDRGAAKSAVKLAGLATAVAFTMNQLSKLGNAMDQLKLAAGQADTAQKNDLKNLFGSGPGAQRKQEQWDQLKRLQSQGKKLSPAQQALLKALNEYRAKNADYAYKMPAWVKAALSIKGVLGSAWRALFGGSQAAGGDYLVTKPTLFLAGEAGPERATFTPRGAPARGGIGGAVTNRTVVHHHTPITITWTTLTGEPSQSEKARLANWLRPELERQNRRLATTGF